jgi:hypothetical protein
LIYIDDKLMGGVSTIDDAIYFITKLSKKQKESLIKKDPYLEISIASDSADSLRVSCLSKGYIYNSVYTAHVVRYLPIL